MATKTLTLGDQEFRIVELNLDQAETIFDPARTDTKAKGREAVVAALQNAGNYSFTIENIGLMPFSTFAKLREATLEISGLATTAAGEATAPAEA